MHPITCVLIGIICLSTAECSIDGAKFIGLGYNILFGNPDGGDLSHAAVDIGIKSTRHILKITDTTARHLIVNDGKTQCVPSSSTSMFYGGKSYQDYLFEYVETDGPGDDTITPYAFTQSTVYKDVAQETMVHHQAYHDSITVCNKGRNRYVMPPLFSTEHDISDEFASAVCSLPIVYDRAAYEKLLDTWGTHVIIEVETGVKRVVRYKHSVAHLADVLLSYNVGVGIVTLEQYLGYGSVVHLNISALRHSDFDKIKGGQVVSTTTIGTSIENQPVALKVLTIARFIQADFFNNASYFQSLGLCNEGLSQYLPKRQNNTLRALAEYARNKGSTKKPSNPEIKMPIAWPHGSYALYKPKDGCPLSPVGFAEGWIRQDSEDDNNRNHWTSNIHLAGEMNDKSPVFHFCVKLANDSSDNERDWPAGSYCILSKGGCPTGFQSGYIYWDDEDSNNNNDHGGILPDGEFGPGTTIYFCCRNDGNSETKILLPIGRPFYLMQFRQKCQKVYGMDVSEEVFYMDTENTVNGNRCSGARPYDATCKPDIELHYCYYSQNVTFAMLPSQIFG